MASKKPDWFVSQKLKNKIAQLEGEEVQLSGVVKDGKRKWDRSKNRVQKFDWNGKQMTLRQIWNEYSKDFPEGEAPVKFVTFWKRVMKQHFKIEDALLAKASKQFHLIVDQFLKFDKKIFISTHGLYAYIIKHYRDEMDIGVINSLTAFERFSGRIYKLRLDVREAFSVKREMYRILREGVDTSKLYDLEAYPIVYKKLSDLKKWYAEIDGKEVEVNRNQIHQMIIDFSNNNDYEAAMSLRNELFEEHLEEVREQRAKKLEEKIKELSKRLVSLKERSSK